MKKINYKILKVMAFSVVMLFMSSTVFAEVQESQQDTTIQDTTTQMDDQQQTMPQEQYQRTGDDMQGQDPDEGVNYSETIEKSELPQEVNSSLDELYPAHKVQEAYRGEDDSYKVKVKNETDEAFVYYDSQGDFLRAHNLSGLQQQGAMPQEQGQRTIEEQDQQGTQQDTTGYQQEEKKDTETRKEDRAEPQEQYQQTGENLKSKDFDQGVDYSESIQKGDLPQEVTSSVDSLYPAHQVTEVFRGENDSYKVRVKNETDEAVVYYDSQGDFLRAENLSASNQQGAMPQEQGQRTMEEQDHQGAQQDTVSTQQKEDKDVGTRKDDKAQPQEQYQQTDENLRSQNFDKGVDYSESIKKGDLPQEVTSSLDDLYPAHEIQEIHQGNDDSYKVKVKNEDDMAVVYYNSQGDFLRAQNLSDRQQQAAMPQQQGQRVQNDQVSNQETQQDNWESDTAKNESSAYPQEQSQRMMDDMKSTMSDKGMEYSEKVDKSELPEEVTNSINEMYPENEISEVYRGEDDTYKVKFKDDETVVYFDDKGKFLRVGKDKQQQASPQEMNQRIEDVEESQDADRWGTENRMPEYENDTTTTGTQQEDWENQGDTLDTEGSAYPQEQNQQIEGNQDEEKFEDNWGPEDMGAHQSTWEDGEGYPQEQNQQATGDAELEDQSTWMGGEGTDTTMTPARIDTTAVYKNQWENGTFEEGDDEAAPQDQYQQTTPEYEDTDTVEFETSPVDTTATYDNQMMEDNNLDGDDMASPQEQYQQTTPEYEDADTTTHDNQMMEDNNLESDDAASPQEQFQATTDEDVDYSEEIQENELPETITTSLDELYPEYEMEKAYRGDDGSYKVKIKDNEEKLAVYYDSDGLFYRDEVLDDMLEDDNKDTNQDW